MSSGSTPAWLYSRHINAYEYSTSWSLNLTGNKKNAAKDSEGKDSAYHARVFEADAIESHRNIQLTRGGMVLFALISGGDHDNGNVSDISYFDLVTHGILARARTTSAPL